MPQPSRGEVWIADFNPVVGHEQGERRPALIVSYDRFNHSRAELAMAVPITSTDRQQVLHVEIAPPEGGLRLRSFAMCDQLRTLSHVRLRTQLGRVSSATMDNVEERLRLVLQL